MIEKTYWNDPCPRHEVAQIACAGCRTLSRVCTDRYPHGPMGVRYCPVCGTRVEENKGKHND